MFPVIAACQNYSLQVKISSECNKGTPEDYNYFTLIDSQLNRYEAMGQPARVPGPGKYKLIFPGHMDIDLPTEVHIDSPGMNTLTYDQPKIVVQYAGLHGGLVYSYCGKPINGSVTDYYPNNQIRIKGVFNKGFLKDSLEKYYPNGALKESYFATDYGYINKKYDSLTHLLYIKKWIRQPEYKQYHIITEFYINKKIKRREIYRNNYLILEEYYRSGQLKLLQSKKQRVEYAENGQITVSYKWSRRKDKFEDIKDNYYLVVSKLIYESTGKRKERMKAYIWSVANQQPLLNLANADWLIKWVKWVNGKKIVLATNDNPDKFFFPVKNN